MFHIHSFHIAHSKAILIWFIIIDMCDQLRIQFAGRRSFLYKCAVLSQIAVTRRRILTHVFVILIYSPPAQAT